jgi:hypothetical protein
VLQSPWRIIGPVAVSRSAMVVGPETSDVTNDQDPDRHCELGAKTAALGQANGSALIDYKGGGQR